MILMSRDQAIHRQVKREINKHRKVFKHINTCMMHDDNLLATFYIYHMAIDRKIAIHKMDGDLLEYCKVTDLDKILKILGLYGYSTSMYSDQETNHMVYTISTSKG